MNGKFGLLNRRIGGHATDSPFWVGNQNLYLVSNIVVHWQEHVGLADMYSCLLVLCGMSPPRFDLLSFCELVPRKTAKNFWRQMSCHV